MGRLERRLPVQFTHVGLLSGIEKELHDRLDTGIGLECLRRHRHVYRITIRFRLIGKECDQLIVYSSAFAAEQGTKFEEIKSEMSIS